MLRHFFFRVHSRVTRAQSDFKFVSASRRNQHASGVRSPEVAADTAAATTKRLDRAKRLQLRGDFANPTVFPDDHGQTVATKLGAFLSRGATMGLRCNAGLR